MRCIWKTSSNYNDQEVQQNNIRLPNKICQGYVESREYLQHDLVSVSLYFSQDA